MNTIKKISAILLIIGIFVATFFACNKEKESATNLSDSDETCYLCQQSFYSISEYQKQVLEKYIQKEHFLSDKDSNDYDFVGVVDLLDETVDYSTIVLRQTGQNKEYYTFLYDNVNQDVKLSGIANFEINGDTVAFTLTFNGHKYIETMFDIQHMTLLSFVENTPPYETAVPLGNSIWDCYCKAREICQNDPGCATQCDFLTWQYCNSVIYLGCVGAHLKAKITSWFR